MENKNIRFNVSPRKMIVATFAALTLIVSSCGNSNKHSENDGHNHGSQTMESPKENKSGSRNEKGELVDATGTIITGCPSHTQMIGSQGDMCPLCNYMVMIPITWDIDGVDTVRVTTLPDYNPPKK